MIDLSVLYKIQYGMYIVTTKHGDKINGQIATVVFQVTNDPVKLAVCLSKNTYTYELITQSKVIGISVLAQETPAKIIGSFGYRCGRSCLKFSGVKYECGITGVPLVVDDALAVLEMNVEQMIDVKTHVIFVGELKSAKKIRDGVAMTYEYYHTVIKGESPENAPTFQRNNHP